MGTAVVSHARLLLILSALLFSAGAAAFTVNMTLSLLLTYGGYLLLLTLCFVRRVECSVGVFAIVASYSAAMAISLLLHL